MIKLLTFTLALTLAASAQEHTMTNTDVVRFVEQGYSTEAIIQRINAARSVEFRISPEYTSQLEKLGVSKEIISAMIRRASTSESTQAANQPIPVAPPTQAAPTARPPATDELSFTPITASAVPRMDPEPPTLLPHWWVVHLRDGREVRIPRADLIRVTKLAYAWEPIGDSFAYHYTIDTSDVWGFRLGLNEDTFWLNDSDNTLQMPKGWTGSTFAWSATDDAEKSTASEFAMRSKWRPGLLPMYLVNDTPKQPTPAFAGTEDNVRIGQATSIFNNSLQKFVIGPAIKPDITADEMKALVTRWVEYYGFEFLRPLLSGKSIDDIQQPAGELESDVLKCLRAAMPKA